MNTLDTVKIYADKNRVDHFYADNSYIIDEKDKKIKTLNNKYNITTTFDVENNKILDKKVKQHFKYGSDIV